MMVWLDGELRDEAHCGAPVVAAGFLSGWGVFTTMGVRAGRALWLERHLARLRRDAAVLNLEIGFDDAALRAACVEVLAANRIESGLARLTVSARGDKRRHDGGETTCLLAAYATTVPQSALRLWLSPFRLDARRPLAGVKCTSYAPWQWLWSQAAARGCDEAIYRESGGAWCEGARSNLFWTRHGEVFTPALSTGCLPGIGRALVIEWARAWGLCVHEGAWSGDELTEADEIFLTNAVSGPRLVAQIVRENEVASTCSAGGIVKRLQNFWRQTQQA